jgi:Tetracyclin repressor-like, C-terminal domain
MRPAVLGWPKWREMDARYGMDLLRQALGAVMKAGMLRHKKFDMLAHVPFGTLTEAAMVIARSPTAAKSREAAEQALASVIAGRRLSD